MGYKNPVVITIDNNYVQHACVMLQSLSANITKPLNVYCIYTDLTKQNQERIANELKGTRLKITFVEFNASVLPNLPIKENDHVSAATFLRIWLPDLFPNLDQLLFIDTDILINGDITPLLNFKITDKPLAAVPDIGMSAEKKAAIGLPEYAGYFNAGVMVVNLAYFRQHALTAKISAFIDKHPELCEFWDQDAINAIVKGNFEVLDYRYNVLSSFYEESQKDPLALKAIEDPAIIHFAGGGNCKPWLYHNLHPHKNLYYQYLKKTSFRGYYPSDLPNSWRIFRKTRFRLFYR